jgi:hypothetical protein
MNIENLKAMQAKLPVYSQKPQELNVSSDEIIHEIASLYIRTVSHNKRRIKTTYLRAYGRPIPVKEANVSEIIYEIKTLLQKLDVSSLSQITYIIRRNLGYKCTFFINDEPLDLQKLELAYKACKEGKSFIIVENILYF